MERHEKVVQGRLDLARGTLLRIADGRGMLVRVVSGSMWITEEGDQRDRFVTAGGHFHIASSGLTLISAISSGTIELSSRYESKASKGLYLPGARPTTHPGAIPCN